MPRAKRICPKPGCPHAAVGRYCKDHAREYEQQRGSSNQRGYGASHQALRRAFIPEILAGTMHCWRCNELIQPDQPWDLGHADHDRTIYKGPEHVRCNRSAGGRQAHT
jgi:hypothetical protein